MAHTTNCVCGDNWRFETTDLATGQIKGVLHPIAAEWEEKDSQPGQGQITVATRDLVPDDVWPHATGVYISQLIDNERVGRWAGIIEQYDASSGNSTSLGLQGIDEYLFHRNFADINGGTKYEAKAKPQTQIGADLVRRAIQPEGIPLVPVAGDSNRTRDRLYNSWDIKNIGEAIRELTEVINGVRYRLTHLYSNGIWRTEIRFLDTLGKDRGVRLRGDIEGATYGVTVDAKDHATWVYAVGEGEEVRQKIAVAYDVAETYPQFHEVPAYKDVTIQSTLDQHARGYVVDHRDPVATPTMTIPGLGYKDAERGIPTPENLQLADRVHVSFEYGLAKFDGYAYILSIGWSLSEGSPVIRTLAFRPEIRASDSIRVQRAPTQPGKGSAPAASAGAISNYKDPLIIDPSGMQHSKDYN